MTNTHFHLRSISVAKAFLVPGKTNQIGNFYQVFLLDQNSKRKIEFTSFSLVFSGGGVED